MDELPPPLDSMLPPPNLTKYAHSDNPSASLPPPPNFSEDSDLPPPPDFSHSSSELPPPPDFTSGTLPKPIDNNSSAEMLPPPFTGTGGTLKNLPRSESEKTDLPPPPDISGTLPKPIHTKGSNNTSDELLPLPVASGSDSKATANLPAPVTSSKASLSGTSATNREKSVLPPPPVSVDVDFPPISVDVPPPPPSGENNEQTPRSDNEPLSSPRGAPPPPAPIPQSLASSTLKKHPHREFDMKERIGKGSFGAVYRAIHRDTLKEVALKKCTDPEDTLQEIKVMQRCDNRNVIKFFGSYMHEGDLWIIMEFCGLGSLPDALKLFGKPAFHEIQAAAITKRIIAGLNYLHKNGLVHRDIKPENILLNDRGEPKLADFGVANTFGTMNARSTLTGSPYYIAPEVIQETEPYDNRCDIWSFGVTLIEILQGQPPHFGQPPMQVMMLIVKHDAPTLKNPKKFSADCNSFLKDCLVKPFKKRLNAKDLMGHKWLRGAPSCSSVMGVLSKTVQEYIALYGGLELAVKEAGRVPPVPPKEEFDNIKPETPELWASATTSEGQTYYYGTVSKQTSWTKPDELEEQQLFEEILRDKEEKERQMKRRSMVDLTSSDSKVSRRQSTNIRTSHNRSTSGSDQGKNNNNNNNSGTTSQNNSGRVSPTTSPIVVKRQPSNLKNLLFGSKKKEEKTPFKPAYNLDPQDKEKKKTLLSRFLKTRPSKREVLDKKILTALYEE